MPLDAVLLDYGDTLFRFDYDEATHVASLERMLDAAGVTDVEPRQFFEELDRRFWAAIEPRPDHAEMDYAALVRESLAAVGAPGVADEVLLAALHASHRFWDPNRSVHPQSLELLASLRAEGLRIGVVSNAFDPPAFLHEDLALEGVAPLIDTAVFSSEVGRRKPHPAIYEAALERLGVEASRTLFAGDRVLEDVIGPSRLGMRTCLALYYRVDEGDHSLADYRAAEPMDILGAVRTEGGVRG